MEHTKSYSFSLLILAILLASSAANRIPATKTRPRLSGNYVEAGEFPYTVGLKTSGSMSAPTCGGAIIGPRHVITEAWCVDLIENLVVMAGCLDHYGDCTEYETEQVVVHPDLGEIGENDVAIVVTTQGIEMTDLVQIIPVYPSDYVEPGTVANISGWTSFSVSEMVWNEVEVIDDDNCKMTWPAATGGNICTDPYTNIGWGDWGCPLVVDGQLVGLPVNSMNPSTLHMRVTYYQDFIDSVLNL